MGEVTCTQRLLQLRDEGGPRPCRGPSTGAAALTPGRSLRTTGGWHTTSPRAFVASATARITGPAPAAEDRKSSPASRRPEAKASDAFQEGHRLSR